MNILFFNEATFHCGCCMLQFKASKHNYHSAHVRLKLTGCMHACPCMHDSENNVCNFLSLIQCNPMSDMHVLTQQFEISCYCSGKEVASINRLVFAPPLP